MALTPFRTASSVTQLHKRFIDSVGNNKETRFLPAGSCVPYRRELRTFLHTHSLEQVSFFASLRTCSKTVK